MSRNALDIETVPNVALICSLPEPEVKIGNLKDPEKIAEKIKEAKEDQISKMALFPYTGRICSYAVYGDSVQKYHTIDEISDVAEMELISEIMGILSLNNNQCDCVITWNGIQFDIPFIFIRAMLLKMELKCPAMSYFTKRYSHFPHTDMMKELVYWSNDHMRLNYASKLILGKSKIDTDVTKFVEMIKTGQSDQIGIYNLMDAQLTYEIFLATEKYLF